MFLEVRCRLLARAPAAAALGLLLCACGDQTSTTTTQAAASHAALSPSDPPLSPFASTIKLQASDLGNLSAVSMTVRPKPGAAARPVSVTYTRAALAARSYLAATGGTASIPVFGLYPGYANQVEMRLLFNDGSVQTQTLTINTPGYIDPAGIYDHVGILRAAAPGSMLGFSYFFVKSLIQGPLVMDIDGEVRWSSNAVPSAGPAAFSDNGFVVGSTTDGTLTRVELDGTSSALAFPSAAVADFHHNIDPGKTGLLAEVDLGNAQAKILESTLLEVDRSGALIGRWSLGDILSAYMQSQGDEPSLFVRNGVDWFHMNAATYDAADDSVIISSRENFVIKLDHATGAIRWILGDPTKYWYTFPSLRAKALQLTPGSLPPIGQHAVSMTSDGLLLLINDGAPSLNQPAGAPAGTSLTYSVVSAYKIDAASMTATEAWRFDNSQSISSQFCSSAYEVPGHSVLVDYSLADKGADARLIGLDPAHNKVFEFQFATTGCNSAWNAIPVPFENLQFLK